MSTLSEFRLADLLAPYLGEAPVPANLYPQLSTYLDLLLKWNARTNLTAIRNPEQIVTRHFGESLFTALQLSHLIEIDVSSRPEPASFAGKVERPAVLEPATLLDFGSGAGFPGLPIQLLLPELHVTLAESQNKKATFLREIIRTLNLPHTEVWAGRVEDLPALTTYDAVTLRAVDNMPAALAAARPRIAPGGYLVTLSNTTFAAQPNQQQIHGPNHLTVILEQVQ